MPNYIAFLRAINVGGHTVKMERLRLLFQELGFSDVSTFIASGNVLFDARVSDAEMSDAEMSDALSLERRIEQHLLQSLGYPVATFLRTPSEVAAVAIHDPFPTAEGQKIQVGFLHGAPALEVVQRVRDLRTPADEIEVVGREIYWLYRGRISESLVPAAVLSRTLGVPTTFRNITTIRRIAARLRP